MNKQFLLRMQAETRGRLDALQKRAEDTSISPDDLKKIKDEVDKEAKNLQDISDQLSTLGGDGSDNGDQGNDGEDDATRSGDEGDGNEDPTPEPDENERGAQHVDPQQRANVLAAITRSRSIQVTHDQADTDKAIRSAFANAVLGRADSKQLRSLGVEAGKGSVTIPEIVATDIITYTEEENLLRKVGTKVRTSGTQGYPVLVKKATANQHKKELAAGKTIPETDIEFDEVELDPSEFDAMATVTKKLIARSDVDVSNVVIDELKKAYARKEAAYMYNGDATDAADQNAGALSKKAAVYYETEKVDLTATGWAQVLYTQLVHMKNKVPTALRKQSRWQMNTAAQDLLENMTDTTGRPLLHQAPDGLGTSFLTYPVDFTDNIVGSTAEAPLFYFGYFPSFHIQDVIGSMEVQTLLEKFADSNRIGFKIYNIMDGQLIYSPLEIPMYKYEPGLADPKA